VAINSFFSVANILIPDQAGLGYYSAMAEFSLSGHLNWNPKLE
jgi:hypothetical protein